MATDYILKQASTREELDSIIEVIWAANHTPYEPFIQLFCPVLGVQPSDLQSAIAESKNRFWNTHQADPSSNWLYAQHIPTGEIVGCAQWQIFPENPFPSGPPKLEAPWWPDQEHREFCESILNQVYKPRVSWMGRPHLALNWMAVFPLHRRHGVASMLMEWGVQKADKMSLEAWMEASPMAKPLYEKFGFRALLRVGFDTQREGCSDQWRRMEHELTPTPFFAMWRPVRARWGGAMVPWELGRG